MRIALLTSAPAWRGSATSYAKIAGGLSARGHAVRMVTAAADTALLPEAGLPFTRLQGSRIGRLMALARILRALGAQALVADTRRDLRLAAGASLLHSARLVYRYSPSSRNPRGLWVDRVCLTRVAACVYQSHYVQEDALTRMPPMARIPAFHIPNGYDTARYAPCPDAARAFRERYRIAAEARVVLSAGALAPAKGHKVAIAALDRVRRRGIDVSYLVCGYGNREAELVSLARSRRLPVIFTGRLDPPEMIAAYGAADLIVHPSLREVFPNVVGEAMACGRPVVASDTGGTGELVGRDGSAGVLVPPADPEALSDAVHALLSDVPRLGAIGQAARRRIQEHYPIQRMVDGYEAALAAVVGGG